ncbi:3-hydroxyacyl-CoA dehydrogenase family protein [Youngiibacter fragilis]|uniref:3-hydroxybutyryl-CoA dehydrogenase n=1 Tax=Youngiibacter fragilis 232.1 TaxID=994573 RepID=V7I9F9_9CLOT|nr:3-hydroxyacyl-CoA dehydrogenase NAD-binding domain-containing protein [Youngiibacter fragilis]ETA81921.1 3-hydroxybutyryl-CoA dehydrogenase [Youngiibacter fragilis 232.1]
MKKVGVIGGGVMGSGITEVISKAGIDVVNVDIYPSGLENSKKRITKDMAYLVKKGALTREEADLVLRKITYSTSYESIKDCDFVIEAVPEKIELKKELFSKLDEIVTKEAILASNASALKITEIAGGTKTPERCIGMHFFHPAPVMKLVEIMMGKETSQETFRKSLEFASRIGKIAVPAPESPGFIVNRILVPMINEAAFLVMEGCNPKDVDDAMKLGANHPMGPLELCDYTGVDITYGTMKALYDGFKDEKYKPCPLLIEMIEMGKCGRKTGQGFYKY